MFISGNVVIFLSGFTNFIPRECPLVTCKMLHSVSKFRAVFDSSTVLSIQHSHKECRDAIDHIKNLTLTR